MRTKAIQTDPVCACDWCGNLLYEGEGIHEPTGEKTTVTGPDGRFMDENLHFCGGECKTDYHKPKPAMVDVSGVDWAGLRRQKTALADRIRQPHEDSDRHIVKVIALINHIQDEAASILGEDKVYGQDN